MAKILFVDDDDLTLQLMEKMVHLLGHEAMLSMTEVDAWAYVQNERPDAVVVDLRLRGTSGLDVIERLRQSIPETQEIPMYIVSAGRSSNDEEEARQVGAAGFIRKPISLEQLSLIAKARNGNGRDH
ncbi:MAG TPA: response regulator [Levilinea sp.]|nr:response regulator [Levilinea sp.]